MAKKKGITVIMSLHEIDLAQKVSDRIICVKGDRIYRYGTPDEIFDEETIRNLYSIDNGFFDPLFGSIELPAPTGYEDADDRNIVPKVFVISSCGKGIPVYRKLQKENTPFVAGILPTNDLDYQLARLLASDVIVTDPFEPISEEAFAKASEAIQNCERVLLTDFPIGETNRRIRELIDLASLSGKLEKC